MVRPSAVSWVPKGTLGSVASSAAMARIDSSDRLGPEKSGPLYGVAGGDGLLARKPAGPGGGRGGGRGGVGGGLHGGGARITAEPLGSLRRSRIAFLTDGSVTVAPPRPSAWMRSARSAKPCLAPWVRIIDSQVESRNW